MALVPDFIEEAQYDGPTVKIATLRDTETDIHYPVAKWAEGADIPAELDDLTDVTTAGIAAGKALVTNGTTWSPGVVVRTVTGDGVDNTDPANPVISAGGGTGTVESVTGSGIINVNNTDPTNPVVGLDEIASDAVTDENWADYDDFGIPYPGLLASFLGAYADAIRTLQAAQALSGDTGVNADAESSAGVLDLTSEDPKGFWTVHDYTGGDALEVRFPDTGGQSFGVTFVSVDVTALTLKVGGVDVVVNPDVPVAKYGLNDGVPLWLTPIEDFASLWLATPIVDLPAVRVHADPSGRTILTGTDVDAVIGQADTALNAKPDTADLADVALSGSASDLTTGTLDDARIPSGIARDTEVAAAYQPLDTDLTAFAALTSAADKVPYATGAGTWALADFSSFARTLIDDTSAAAARNTLGIYKAIKTASSSKSLAPAIALDPDLQVTVPAGTYAGRVVAMFDSATNADLSVDIAGPGGSTVTGSIFGPGTSASAVPSTISYVGPAGTTSSVGGVGTGTAVPVLIEFVITTITSGAVGMRWTQASSQATSTSVQSGSLRLEAA